MDISDTCGVKQLTIPVRSKDCDCAESLSNASVSHNRCSMSYSRTPLKHLLIMSLLVVIIGLTSRASAMPGAYLCHAKIKCLHGGVLRVPDNPFDYCRCQCPKRYAGLRCEFNKKIRRMNNRLKRLVKVRNELRELLQNRRHSIR